MQSKEIEELRSNWHGDVNHAYNREKQKKSVMATKGLDGL